MLTRDACNAFRYRGGPQGHYESYFLRANHPTLATAFWIRYTVFCPRGAVDRSVGELWAIFADSDAGQLVATKEVFPLSTCNFSTKQLAVSIGAARLDNHSANGAVAQANHQIAWDLRYTAPRPPLLLLPESAYEARLPKAKALVSAPSSVFDGDLLVNGKAVSIDAWVGSQNHNWGSQHTDRYAWGQVAGFDNEPDSFLECATASIRLGPVFTPPLSFIALRLGGEEFAFNGLWTALRAKGNYRPFSWELRARRGRADIEIKIEGRPEEFIALPYDNPPGGQKICLNSKLASCHVTLRRPGKAATTLTTRHRAAFEILQDEYVEGIARLSR